jgi:hypothetical protein
VRATNLVRVTTLLGALVLGWASLACSQMAAPSTGLDLTTGERELARELAEREITAKRLRTDDRLYAVDFELVQPKDEKGERGAQRLARVTHYRYDGDLAIISYVDLSSRRVVQTQTLEHPSVPVSQEEFDIAKGLLLANETIRRQLGENAAKVVPEALLMNFPDPKDRLYGHRVLRFVFRRDRAYLRQPVAWVDLTARTVTIEPPADSDHGSAH